MALCQQYVTYFCTEAHPDKFADPIFATDLSERWQRVAIQQAAGIAHAWRTNRDKRWQAYIEKLNEFETRYPTEAERTAHAHSAPQWREFTLPHLHNTTIQANANVVVLAADGDLPLKLETSKSPTFDFWVRISTLKRQQVIWLPIQLPKYHQRKLKQLNKTIADLNTSTSLNRGKDGRWWLTISIEQAVKQRKLEETAAIVGIDTGIANFVTTSTGQHYGSFHGKLHQRHQRDRLKRQRKAKLRACLEKKGIPPDKLPSTASVTGARLMRQMKQNINRAVNEMLRDHPEATFVMEDLSVATMRFKSKRMNAYLSASNLGRIPTRLEWEAEKQGFPLYRVNPAYSSQECPRCHFTHRHNRPDQQTFCCGVCGYQANADEAASRNLASRWNDIELASCRNLTDVKALLSRRHQDWREANGYP